MSEPVTDLYEDMATLNALYEELCWDPETPLEFKADFENDQITIKLKKEQEWGINTYSFLHATMALLATAVILLGTFFGAAMLTQSGNE